MTYEQGFGARLKAARRKARLTQERLGEKIYADRCTIQKWENGSRCPRTYFLPLLEQALNVSVQYLVTGEEKSE